MGELLLIIVSTSLVNNLVLDYMLGADPVMATTRRLGPAQDMAALMLIIMPIVSACTWLFHTLVLETFAITYLQLPALVLLVSLLVILSVDLTARLSPRLYQRVRVFVPLVLVNSTVLGVALLAIESPYGILVALFMGLGSALGYALVLLSFSAIRERVMAADVPRAFRGMPILMITLGLIALAYMGFNGMASAP